MKSVSILTEDESNKGSRSPETSCTLTDAPERDSSNFDFKSCSPSERDGAALSGDERTMRLEEMNRNDGAIGAVRGAASALIDLGRRALSMFATSGTRL